MLLLVFSLNAIEVTAKLCPPLITKGFSILSNSNADQILADSSANPAQNKESGDLENPNAKQESGNV